MLLIWHSFSFFGGCRIFLYEVGAILVYKICFRIKRTFFLLNWYLFNALTFSFWSFPWLNCKNKTLNNTSGNVLLSRSNVTTWKIENQYCNHISRGWIFWNRRFRFQFVDPIILEHCPHTSKYAVFMVSNSCVSLLAN